MFKTDCKSWQKNPIIGLTSSFGRNGSNDQVQINQTYLDYIRKHGGIPVILPADAQKEELEFLVGLCDGILMTGGVDLNPALYGEEKLNDSVEITPVRDKSEYIVCELAAAKKLPMLGICRGIQLMNVFFGGTLYQDMPTQCPSEIRHRMEPPFNRLVHQCFAEKNTLLFEITQKEVFGVNTSHHQAIKDAAPGFVVAGRSEDSVIEAIWNPQEKFMLGVQWHPERIWEIESASARIAEAFIAACRHK